MTNTTHTIDGQMGTLRYIADSPPEVHGGFAAQTVDAAKWALAEIARLTANDLTRYERDQIKAVEAENERLKTALDAARRENLMYHMALKARLNTVLAPAIELLQQPVGPLFYLEMERELHRIKAIVEKGTE